MGSTLASSIKGYVDICLLHLLPEMNREREKSKPRRLGRITSHDPMPYVSSLPNEESESTQFGLRRKGMELRKPMLGRHRTCAYVSRYARENQSAVVRLTKDYQRKYLANLIEERRKKTHWKVEKCL